MLGSYDFKDDKEKNYYVSLIRYGIEQLKLNRIEEFNLSNKGINPYQVWQILHDEFNYEFPDFETNGWEQDTWMYFTNKSNPKDILCLFSCGMTYELKLTVSEEVFDAST